MHEIGGKFPSTYGNVNRFFPFSNQNLWQNALKLKSDKKSQHSLNGEILHVRCVVNFFFFDAHRHLAAYIKRDCAFLESCLAGISSYTSWFDWYRYNAFHSQVEIHRRCQLWHDQSIWLFWYRFAASKLQKSFFVHFFVVFRNWTSFKHTRSLDEFGLNFNSRFFRNMLWRRRRWRRGRRHRSYILLIERQEPMQRRRHDNKICAMRNAHLIFPLCEETK